MTITAEQREQRRHSLGGSDAAAVLGVSPYRTPLDLYREKVGELEPDNLDGVEVVRWGDLFEDVVAREYAERAGLTLHRVNQTLVHPDHPWMTAHLDRRVVGVNELAEIKTTRYLHDDRPRADHITQCLHYMAVGGYDRAHLVYLIGGQRLVAHVIERDSEAVAGLVAMEAEFWARVQRRDPPPPLGLADVRARYAEGDAGTLTADSDLSEAVARLRELKAEHEALSAHMDAAQAEIMERMGKAGADILSDDHGDILATWKRSKPARSLDRKAIERDHPEIADAYTTERPGSRRFMLKPAKVREVAA